MRGFIEYLTSQWFTPQIIKSTQITQNDKPDLIGSRFCRFIDSEDLSCSSDNYAWYV